MRISQQLSIDVEVWAGRYGGLNSNYNSFK